MNFLLLTEDELSKSLEDSSLLEDILDEAYDSEDESRIMDIDKSWDILHYFLTGSNIENSTNSLSRLFFSGQIIDEDQDLGYGPGYYLLPEQVKELEKELEELDVDLLKSKFDLQRMNRLEIYLTPLEEDRETTIKYILIWLESVRKVFKLASQGNMAIVTFLN